MNVLNCIASVFTIFGVFFAVYEYLRNRQAKTLDKLEELQLFLSEKEDGINEYMHKIHYMNRLNRFASAVNKGVYSKRTVKSRASRLLISQYQEFMQEYIPKRREMYSNPDYYRNIEELINYIGK